MAEYHSSVALTAPRHRSAGRGGAWIQEGWGLFKALPGLWLGLILLWMLIQFAAGIVPLAGFIMAILGPALNAGILFAARDQEQSGQFGIGHLLAGFRSERFGQLALLGFFTLLLMLLVALVIGIVFALLLGGDFDPEAMQIGSAQILVGLLLLLVLMLPAIMAVWFSGSLVALHDCTPMQAFKLSFAGCLKNIGSLTVFSLILIPLSLLAMLPLGLGLLILLPVGFLAMYRAYIDIFRAPSEAAQGGFDLG